MRQGVLRQSPALVVSLIALFVALGGTVYAGAKINGKSIRAKSLPGNRLKPKSVPGNRLRPRSIGANRLRPGVLRRAGLAGPLTGVDINELSLGQVPTAAHAATAGSAQSAVDAETALNAVHAIDADTVNGHSAGCKPGTVLFAGACWQASSSVSPSTAPDAAENCALQGGALPEALQLAAFAKQPGVNLDDGDEWSSDIASVSGLDLYSVVTVSAAGEVNHLLSSNSKRYRCVIPLVT